MTLYKCKRCEYIFESMNEIPYCPSCECEQLEEIPFNDDKYLGKEELEHHHIWPKFMDNPNGVGQQYPLNGKTHSILHWNIINWIWKEICHDKRQEIIKIVINKSKEFIGVDNGTKN